MGLFALTLRWLDWRLAAALAAAALLFNLFVMPRIGRGIYRDAARKRDAGIVAYPAMVLLLILLFRHELGVAAALWAMMAFGDPAASIAGKLLGGPRLPWNRKKTWSGFLAYALVGGLAAGALWTWVSPGGEGSLALPFGPLAAVLAPVVLLGAFLESVETGLDDNWIPAIPCALLLEYELFLMWQPLYWNRLPSVNWVAAFLVNASIAAVTWGLRIVRASGAFAGLVVGFLILGLCGWSAYAILWAFFLFGTLATRLGLLRKAKLGTAQADKGRRGARHVLANCVVGTALCVLGYLAVKGTGFLFGLAFAASFAAALADTLGTEIGSLYGRRTFSLVSARLVHAGTPGGVSFVGLIAGLCGAALIGVVSCLVGLVAWSFLWLVAAAGFLGSVAESLARDLGRSRGISLDHEFANAFNTFVGAVLAWQLAIWLQGLISVPHYWRL